MGISMGNRKEIVRSKQKKYKRSNKKGKTQIITSVADITGWTREHTARCLRGLAQSPGIRKGRGRKPRYGMPHKQLLKEVWHLLDFACSRRLRAGMKDLLEALAANGHLNVDNKIKREMEQMSHGTIDRLLQHDREELVGHGRATTKPGSLLKHQVPIRRGNEWDDNQVGFLEIDLVAHCGNSSRGEFVFTLDTTDIKSGWTECRAVINRAQIHTFAAMKVIRGRLPFSLLGIDSDNGSEFINSHFLNYCCQENLVFTRGRPNTSNDSCHIEQKNWSVVRQTIGYYRFEGQQAVDLLNEIYQHLRLMNNFFMPSAKLLVRTRDGSRISRTHDKPLSPFRRLLASHDLSDEEKANLIATFRQLDPLILRQQIHQLSRQLQSLAVPFD